jgi:hypothetical protein
MLAVHGLAAAAGKDRHKENGVMLRRLVETIVLLCMLVPARAAAENGAFSEIAVTVEVINGTTGGAAVGGAEVTLAVYGGQGLLRTLRAGADWDGRAVFEKVPVAGRTFAVASAVHQETSFSSGPVELDPGKPEAVVKLPVFDVTTDRSSLYVAAHHIFVSAAGSALRIEEYVKLVNSSDMAVSSSRLDEETGPAVLEVPLPKGFFGFSSGGYFEEDALVFTEDGFYDTMAVPPGQFDVSFSYALEIDRSVENVTKRFSLPTRSVILFGRLDTAKIDVPGEKSTPFTRGDGVEVDCYRLGEFDPSRALSFSVGEFTVSGFDKASFLAIAAAGASLVWLAAGRGPGK